MSPIEELRKTVKKLRAPDGCSWDREQTHESLISCLIEECSEVIEAIEEKDDPLLEEELGDLLLSILMHAEIASETDRFDLDDVARGVNEKLIRRHPHVFGPNAGKMGTEEILVQWEKIKAEEKAAKGITTMPLFKDLPPRLPALNYAGATAKQIRKKELGPVPSYDPEQLPTADEKEMGKTLFHLAALCDQKGWDAETLLRQYADQVRKEAEAAQ
ncbi:MazG family protein [Puniceicoccus vermicola]|uniref:MazG family protein n=1 Tax=Puniceicoccus vermicola TaxID=388746 RepID=A0A7X1AZJ5_9BACT|nr:MazG family protein [Puniceicoccus vermicola]MBC2602861.1 MazG family protein [Puniceicoccus vermicola]